MESSSGEDMRLRCRSKVSFIREARLNRIDDSGSMLIFGENMENTRKLNPGFEMVAWGAFFLVWATTELFKSLPDGTGAIGVGLILLALNAARYFNGIPISGFTMTLGILALIGGVLELAEAALNLPFELPIFPILLTVLGVVVLARGLKVITTNA
jgi:hypothetical protein